MDLNWAYLSNNYLNKCFQALTYSNFVSQDQVKYGYPREVEGGSMNHVLVFLLVHPNMCLCDVSSHCTSPRARNHPSYGPGPTEGRAEVEWQCVYGYRTKHY
jgi:hypothetical protein